MVVAMDGVSFECGRGLGVSFKCGRGLVRRNLVIQYVQQMISMVLLLRINGAGAGERLTGGPTCGGELVGTKSVGTESVGVDKLTAAPRCTFTLSMFPDNSGNKQTAGLDGREAVGPVIVGGSSEAVRTVSMLTTETGGRVGPANGSGSGAESSRAGQRGEGERRASTASA
jgi:hypothetical protein